MHELLLRQIREHLGAAAESDRGLAGFFEAVSASYVRADEDREALSRSLDLASRLGESERRFRDVLETAEAIVVLLDVQGHITFCNEHLVQVSGYARAELLGRNWFTMMLPPEETHVLFRTFVDGMKRGAIPTSRENPIVTRTGERRLVAWRNMVVRNAAGVCVGAASIGLDVTDVRRAEEALRESEERYALAMRGATDGLWDWDLKRNHIYFSERWKAMLGAGDDEIGNDPRAWFSRVHPDDLDALETEIAAHIEGLTPHFENEHRIRHADGTYRWMLCRGIVVRDANARPARMAGSQSDITKRKLAEEKLLFDARHDSLTGLPNRQRMLELLRRAIHRAREDDSFGFAVLFLDIDRFKVVNDSLGHVAGDDLLVLVGRRIERAVEDGGTVARLGGDEFAVLLDRQIGSVDDATRVAERVHRALEPPIALHGHEIFPAASIGVVLGTKDYDTPEDLLRDADNALHRAKALGKARHAVFDRAMHSGAVALLKLEGDLRRAVARDEFRVLYQPIVSLRGGDMVGFEALVRWQHPDRGLVAPSEFIPVAEETGIIVPMGFFVLREACRQLRRWHERHDRPLTVSVNLSARQFAEPELVSLVELALLESGVRADSLSLEITETAMMMNAEAAGAMLEELRGLGLKLQMDDFGTGYSSLSYLYRFPIDSLKIDRSFVSGAGAGKNHEIARTIVSLARTLRKNVVAEGIETAEQLALMRELSCEYGQGYFFSRPVDADTAERLIVENRRW